jgi:hypothetical protein
VIHLLQFLVKLLLNLEREIQDNSKLVGSLLIGGLWLLLLADLFPAQLGIWREWFIWSGWILIGMAVFLFVRRKIWVWRGRNRIAKRRGSLFRT